MFLKRLFGAKQETRITLDPQALLDLARNAPDSAARKEACHALTDLPALRAIATDDGDAGVRDVASARYRNLLCGPDAGAAPKLEERRREVRLLTDQGLLAHVARHADTAQLRHDAISALHWQDAIADCAMDDPLASNRLHAAERLTDKAALERVAKRVGKKDKSVFRLVRQRLKDIARDEARPALVREQAAALCEKAERLGRFDNWDQDRAVLAHLDQQWADIDAEAEEPLRERYRQLREGFLAEYESRALARAGAEAKRQARAATSEQLQQLVSALQDTQSLNELTAAARHVEAVEQQARALTDSGAEADQAYTKALDAARAHVAALKTRERDREAAERLLADAKAALDSGREVERRTVDALRKRLDKLEGAGAVGAECAAVVDKLDHRLEKHREQIARKLEKLPDKLAQLDAMFEQGQLKKVEPLYQSINATLDQARAAGVTHDQLARARAHLERLAPRLRELQRWRRWSADTHREALCEQVEGLAADTSEDIEPIANRLLELRAAWRRLDQSAAPASDDLWQRFHASAEQVQSRCQPFLDTRAKLRAANRVQREALCEELERFLEQVDWERMDWKKAGRAAREMRDAWSAVGEVEARYHRPLEGRFRKALRRLEKALADEREQNQALKRELIAQMGALAQEPDLERAIAAAKDLQQRWHTTVPARQRDENTLWQSFRTASDAVFGRRTARHEAELAEQQEHLGTREAICRELQDLAEQADDDARLRTETNRLRSRWDDTERLPLPRGAHQALQRRWRDALRSATEALERLESARALAELEHLARRAEYCDAAARALAADAGPAEPEHLATGWAALPAPDDALSVQRLDEAFALVLRAATDPDARARLAEAMAENAAQREQLCLHLEIVAGTESPPELTEQRMALQVSRLRERMTEGEPDSLSDGNTLLRNWYLCTPAAADDGAARRLARVKQALLPAADASSHEPA